ncbi:MAG: DUF2855 family protein [Pseudomonadota bacterium]
MITEFQVRKTDLSETQLVERSTPALGEGEVLVKVERFALTANNITYGVVGEKIGYWKFFPCAEGWGVIPVWAMAEVAESRCPDMPLGERLYGYFPMGSHLVMTPQKVKPMRFIDGATHRAELPPVYNSYARVAAEPGYDPSMDDDRILLFPLYATSFCLYDFLLDNDWFGADQVVIVSASSKTAIGLAMALKDDATSPPVVGLTSPKNLNAVNALGLYDSATTYGALEAVDASKATVIVDMSGNGAVLSRLHSRLKDNMKYTSNVGITHWDENDMGPDFIRERSHMFFAPGHIQKRSVDWEPGVFEQKALTFWREAALKSRNWLTVETVGGLANVGETFHALRLGRVAPDKGIVVKV